jgi:hypothetical protein
LAQAIDNKVGNRSVGLGERFGVVREITDMPDRTQASFLPGEEAKESGPEPLSDAAQAPELVTPPAFAAMCSHGQTDLQAALQDLVSPDFVLKREGETHPV